MTLLSNFVVSDACMAILSLIKGTVHVYAQDAEVNSVHWEEAEIIEWPQLTFKQKFFRNYIFFSRIHFGTSPIRQLH
jgi:hypothetical protein